jgi:uncharacterized membrane protein
MWRCSTRPTSTKDVRAPASVKGHPLRSALVAFPLALWSFSLACDMIGLIDRENWLWQSAAFYALVGGLIGALAAALPGLIDVMKLRDPVVRGIGVHHMIFKLAVLAVFAGDIWLRLSDAIGTRLPVAVSLVGITLAALSAWLGGELVYLRGVGVARPASAQALLRRGDTRAPRRLRAR